MSERKLQFPEGFLFGTATAGHQVEGHNYRSDWWKFEQEGKVYDGTVSGRAVDYWNRYEEDHAIMKKFGFQGFRLGIEWAKIEPYKGKIDTDALKRYRDILTSLRDNGIKICLTLYHWVLPLWFAEMGGWTNPNAVKHFMKFVRLVANELGEFPDLWCTLNEPSVPPIAGYLGGVFPPEKKSFSQYRLVVNRLLHAHAEAYAALHEIVRTAPGGGPVMAGVAHAYQHVETWGSRGLPGLYEKFMGEVFTYGSFEGWDKAISSGRMPLPFGIGEEVAGLKDSYDYAGINYYTRVSMRFNPMNPKQNFVELYDIPEGIEENEMGWQIYPPGFYAVMKKVYERFRKPIYITENGVADVNDVLRPKYTLEHLAQVHRAIEDGIDVRGYFHWSYIDNFEWREGYVKKLGLIACDWTDPRLTRVPRKSAYMYSDIIKNNAITETIVGKYCPEAQDGVFGGKWKL